MPDLLEAKAQTGGEWKGYSHFFGSRRGRRFRGGGLHDTLRNLRPLRERNSSQQAELHQFFA